MKKEREENYNFIHSFISRHENIFFILLYKSLKYFISVFSTIKFLIFLGINFLIKND